MGELTDDDAPAPEPIELEIERTEPIDDTRNPQSEQLNLF